MSEPISSAADLHRAIIKRGLELRPKVGRDAALIQELSSKLGIPEKRFISELKKSGKSAEDYLRALISVAKPFAQMFQEIWNYLAQHCAPKAGETLRIQFGFGERSQEVDWEQFRVMVETSKRILSFGAISLWPSEELFKLANILNPQYIRGIEYNPRESITLSEIAVPQGIDILAWNVREMIQSSIDYIYQDAHQNRKRVRSLPELQVVIERVIYSMSNEEQKMSVSQLIGLIKDLVPSWSYIFQSWNNLPINLKTQAYEYFEENIEPMLISADGFTSEKVIEALELLDLPFWRYRWHTYEIWATVKALESLEEFNPQPVIVNGHIAMDGTQLALVSTLRTYQQKIYAYVQSQTALPQPLGTRKHIKPDLRFSTDQPATNEATVSIIEFKQRKILDAVHALEVLRAYAQGVGTRGGVVMINYDTAPNITIPLQCRLIGDVHPGHPNMVARYQQAVRDCFQNAGFEPDSRKLFVLLDVSRSMSNEYGTTKAQDGLTALYRLPHVKIFRFNDELLFGSDWTPTNSVAVSGGTQLGKSLKQLFSTEHGVPDRLLIVTDGDYEHPVELSRIQDHKECRAAELLENLDWLIQ